MLLTAIFPLCDTRSFLAEDTGRISSRGFLPARGLFLPGFGAISAGRPRRGAPGGLVCLARRAFRPAGPASLGGKPIRWVWREVWDHGDAVVHFDVGIGARLGQPGMAGRWLAALVEEWTRLLVDIPAARRSKPVELRHAGLLLAPAYVQATTLRSHRVEVRQSWVAAGDPCFFVEWSDGEQLDMRGMPSLVPVGKGVRIAWCELPSAGPRALVGYLAHDGSRSGLSWAGKLRGELAALHIERECLWATLGQIACGRLAPPGKPRLLPPDATSGSAPVLSDAPAEPAASAPGAEEPPPTDWPASNALQRYLNDATSLLTRRSQTLPFPSLVGVVEPNQAEASRKDGARFSTALDRALSDLNVRGNVRRKVAGWVSHEVGESLHQVSGDLRKQPNLQKWSPCRPQRPQNVTLDPATGVWVLTVVVGSVPGGYAFAGPAKAIMA